MTYEYRCFCCGHTLEIEHGINDDVLTECPKCHVTALKRLISGTGAFVLKGGGWSSDGYTQPGEKSKE